MTWKNAKQLSKIHTNEKFINDFSNLFTLKIFFENSIVEADYKPPDEFENVVILTSIGKELASKIQNSFKDISMAEINYALFLKFYHQSLLIDVENTNSQIIRNILNNKILDKNIKYPWIFGTVLYDRYFEIFEDNLLKLSYEQTMTLLKDTPQGVFQLRDILIGPFGVLTSSCFRYLPPVLDSNLWHCSDLTCEASHHTQFSSCKPDTETITNNCCPI